MADRKHIDPVARASSERTSSAPRDTATEDDVPAGRVVHDSRGNAVWDWLKQTGRQAIDSTSRLLKRLDAPELRVDEESPELRLESDRNSGGGYDPYNSKTPARKPNRRK
jgi:hypothetical protein